MSTMTFEEYMYACRTMTAFRSKEERDELMKPKGFMARHAFVSLIIIVAVSIAVFKIALRVLAF